MAIRFSTALRNFIANKGSVKEAFLDGKLDIYPGVQPADADSAAGQTPIVTITKGSGTFVEGTSSNYCVWAAQITAADVPHAGEVINIKIADYDLANSKTLSYTVLAEDVVSGTKAGSLLAIGEKVTKMINEAAKNPVLASVENRVRAIFLVGDYVDVDTVAIIVYSKFPGEPFKLNTCTITSATHLSILEAEITTNQASVAAWKAANRKNGLHYGEPDEGVLEKESDAWSGVSIAAGGVAGWFRFCGNQSDPDTADTNSVYLRMDGSIGTSGADVTVGSTTIQGSSTITVDSADFTVPLGS